VVSFCLIGSPELHCIVLGLTPPLGLKDRREKALNAKNVAKDATDAEEMQALLAEFFEVRTPASLYLPDNKVSRAEASK
jgi:hypothetical protein